MKEVEIKLKVTLDDTNVPQSIDWVSDDPPSKGSPAGAKGFFLSLFDEKSLETLKIDLWTSKLEIGEMNRLCYYSLKGMADSYFNATKDKDHSNDLARFAQYFGEETGVLKKEPESPK